MQIDEAMSLNFYNGWPAHGPNSTQILETNVISSLQEHLQIYIRDGRKEATLLKVKEKVLKIIQDFVIVEDSASPDGNALRLETGTVLNFQG